MRTLWILNHYAQSPYGKGSTRHFYLGKHLINYGWRITVFSSSVEHLTGKQTLPPRQLVKKETVDGVEFLRYKTPPYFNNTPLRILNMLVYTAMVLSPLGRKSRQQPDVIIGSTVHPFASLAAKILAERYNVPFVFEIRDLWPKSLIDMGFIKEKSLVARFFYKLEKYLCDAASSIICVLPGIENYLRDSGVSKKKIVWIPNGAEAKDAYLPIRRKNTFVLMYIGSHGMANDLFTLIRTLSILENRKLPVKLVCKLIGDGPEKRKLIKEANRLKVSSVIFEDSVPKLQVPKIASQADAFVITVRNLPQLYQYGISMNKIFDYMSVGRPIIIATNAFRNPIEEAKCGITVPPESPEALADGIQTLINTPYKYRVKMGKQGLSYFKKNHSYEILAKRLDKVLRECLQRNKN